MHCRCDSFGNRPVNVTNNYHRKNSFGSGRVRSGSTGNRPVKVNNNIRSVRQPVANTAQFNESTTNKAQHAQRSSQFVIRQPPHQQQSQQHNFAAPRKGIFNHSNNSTVTSNVQLNKEFNAKPSQNNKNHNKENLTGKSDGSDGKLNATSGASSSVSSGSPVTTATVGSAGSKQ